MSRNKADQEREKIIQERCQILLNKLLKEEDNKYCVDCDSKGPRWASWNIGVFLCIRCAGIHRNLGVHISKVRSVNLDSWTPAQVSSMQCMGNSRGRAVYEAGVPDHFKRPTSDSGLEQFIRSKYEKKKYLMKDWVATKPPDLPEGWQTLIEQEKIGKSRDGKPQMNLPPSTNTPSAAKQQVNLPTSKSSGRINSTSRASSGQTQVSTSTSSKVTTSAAAISSVDLLGGLITSSTNAQNIDDDDMFSNFVSAPPLISSSVTPSASTNSVNNTSTPASNLEQDFFNQVSVGSSSGVTTNGGSGETSKMSNSSIMALFSSVPQNKGPTMIASPAAPQAVGGYTQPQQQVAAPHQQLPQSLYPSHQLQALGQQQHFPTGQQPALFNNNKPATGLDSLAAITNQINSPNPSNQTSQNIFQMNNQFSDLNIQSSWTGQQKNQLTPTSIQGLYNSGRSGGVAGNILSTPSTNMFTTPSMLNSPSAAANMFSSPVSTPAPSNLFNPAAAANGQTSNNLANSLWN